MNVELYRARRVSLDGNQRAPTVTAAQNRVAAMKAIAASRFAMASSL